jgi:hypothetical protein
LVVLGFKTSTPRLSPVTLVPLAVPHTYSTVGLFTSITKHMKPESDVPVLVVPFASVMDVSDELIGMLR